MTRRLLPALMASLGGPLLVAVLLANVPLFFSGRKGLVGEVGKVFTGPLAQTEIRRSIFFEAIPLYAGIGLAGFLVSALLRWQLARRRGPDGAPAPRPLSPLDGLLLSGSGLLLVHAWLWWEAPCALWRIWGLAWLPFWVSLAWVFLAPCALFAWTARRSVRPGARLLVWGSWVLLFSAVGNGHRLVPPLDYEADSGGPPAKVLTVSLDGLRADLADQAGVTLGFSGLRYPNAYAVAPQTRGTFNLLWGEDPLLLDAAPSRRAQRAPLRLLDAVKAAGGRTRFYIDEAGAVGHLRRIDSFDEFGAPRHGWKALVNGALAGFLPLYGAWVSHLWPFPYTTPWTPMDHGLRHALAKGRGAELVMYHSVFTHQPVVLTRRELATVDGWWTFRPADFNSMRDVHTITPELEQSWDVRLDPQFWFRIRAQSVLDAWRPIWQSLARHPQYRDATRVLLSDHGAKFFPLGKQVTSAAMHGLDLDPWQLRIALLVDGPGFETGVAGEDAASLALLRNAMARRLLRQVPIRPTDLQSAEGAPLRFQMITASTHEARPHRCGAPEFVEIYRGLKFEPDGHYETDDALSLAAPVSVGVAKGARMSVWRPLVGGGAERLSYEGLRLLERLEVEQAEYDAQRGRVEAALALELPELTSAQPAP